MATSKKIEIVYHNGQPDGIRSLRRHLSTMTTYIIPRTMLTEAKEISGINRPGVYYLINEDTDNSQPGLRWGVISMLRMCLMPYPLSAVSSILRIKKCLRESLIRSRQVFRNWATVRIPRQRQSAICFT